MKKISGQWWVLMLMAGAAFCGPAFAEDHLKAEGTQIPFLGNVVSAVAPELAESPPSRVALLPATVWEKVKADYARAEDVDPVGMLRTVLFGRFSVLPYHDVHIRDVDHILKEAGLDDPVILGQKTPPELGKLLGVDALLYLDVEKAENVTAGIHSYTGYVAAVRMVRAADGKELWCAKLDYANRGGVISFKSSQLGALIGFEQQNRIRKKAFRLAAEEWSRRVTEDLRSKLEKAQSTEKTGQKEISDDAH